MKTIAAFLCMTIGGCAVTGTLELPSKYGSATLSSDGKTWHAAIRLPSGYSK